jgi:hypothetical protein
MKTILLIGIFGTFFMYVMFSFFNKTWDPMGYSPDSVYFFACSSAICWIMGMLIHSLELDKPIK